MGENTWRIVGEILWRIIGRKLTAQLAGLPRPVIQRASEILKSLEASSGKAIKINPEAPQQMALFPETNPMLDELKSLDINSLSPIEALNKLYEWQKKFAKKQ